MSRPPGSPRRVLVLGSAAIKIGEAGEFDYSGSQALKALKAEGCEVVLINPNIATVQTSDYLADRIYFLPVTEEFVESVIEKERPDGILLGFGGQTALNCGLALDDRGTLARHGVEVLGTPIAALRDSEDRARFARSLEEIGVPVPRSHATTSVAEAVDAATALGCPVMVRLGFALGGLGSGVCHSESQLRLLVDRALGQSRQILVEEYLEGWKEIEYEVVRDGYDNAITVCNMENFDPLGIHTGESVVVAPSQTLNDAEYHELRSVSLAVARHLGIVGECNIQFAVHPGGEGYRVIELNARLSRSSALASKATGYPLAAVAARLALGHGLHELPNAITRVTKAFFEPALDYVVVKVPRWDLKKFKRAAHQIGSGMKSVGEVMAIGRSFEEALQKALRMLDIGVPGLIGAEDHAFDDLERELVEPTDRRLFAVAEALRSGLALERIHELTRIDRWFLHKIAGIVELGDRLKYHGRDPLPEALLREAKQRGFADCQIAKFTGHDDDAVRAQRHALGIRPAVCRIDTLAAEFPAQTNYMYLSYYGREDHVQLPDENAVILLGAGAYRIGCSVEFDWCCVHAGITLRRLGYRTIMINCNPETVSTDHDEFDQLFFEEITAETIGEIHDRLRPLGVIVSMGGQIPNNLALALHGAGIRVLGTAPSSIDTAEDRHKFSRLLDELGIDQPAWQELSTLAEAKSFAAGVGYPVLVRPSYVLSGAAMAVASNDEELSRYLRTAARVSPAHPTVITKFLVDAKEIELDGIARSGEIVSHVICEHVENAGVHSGDATLVCPPQRTYLETMRRIRRIARRIAAALKIDGPFNLQFVARDNEVKVIECNLRASRSFPFVSKVVGHNFAETATRVIMGEEVSPADNGALELNHVGVKVPQFSFTRLEGADPTLGVEMASTGEVACLGEDFNEAFLKALLSVGLRLPIRSMLLSTGSHRAKVELLEAVRAFERLGIRFCATAGTQQFLQENGIAADIVHWPLEDRKPDAVDAIRAAHVDLVINIPKNDTPLELTNGYMIRRAAVDYGVPLLTNRQLVV